MAYRHLLTLWEKADEIDYEEGLLAYERYNTVMRWWAQYYGFKLGDVCSAFVALSPNSDYHGNLRSLSSVLYAKSRCIPAENVTVSTYNACRDRAYSYLDGQVSFLDTVKGPKIRAFRDNIMRPKKSPLVTVDGHMALAWHGKEGTMKDAARLMKSKKDYLKISNDIVELAVAKDLMPCQVQAILWLTRKRILGIKYDPQLRLFAESDDASKVLCSPRDFPPYPLKNIASQRAIGQVGLAQIMN